MLDFSTNEITSFVISSREVNVDTMMKLHPLLTLRRSDERTLIAIASQAKAGKIDSCKHLLSADFLLGRIAFVSMVIVLLLYFFERDTNVLIIKPIEDMMQRVRDVARNPLSLA